MTKRWPLLLRYVKLNMNFFVIDHQDGPARGRRQQRGKKGWHVHNREDENGSECPPGVWFARSKFVSCSTLHPTSSRPFNFWDFVSGHNDSEEEREGQKRGNGEIMAIGAGCHSIVRGSGNQGTQCGRLVKWNFLRAQMMMIAPAAASLYLV